MKQKTASAAAEALVEMLLETEIRRVCPFCEKEKPESERLKGNNLSHGMCRKHIKDYVRALTQGDDPQLEKELVDKLSQLPDSAFVPRQEESRRVMTVENRKDLEPACFGGRLIRWGNNLWAWRDGTKEPRVRDETLSSHYNFRIRTYADGKYVEVPVNVAKRFPDEFDFVLNGSYKRANSGDDTGPKVINLNTSQTYHQSSRPGGKAIRKVYLVPIEDWEANDRVIGCVWDLEHEQEILNKAKSLGWNPQP